ncbi:MAG: hypothetical protein IJ513_08685 [Bacteroidaceae bacterium]|nr:hypothetical protein [Bacteroidaceae bacterium]
MTTTEMVFDFLRKQGFCPEVDENNGSIYFKYQMTNFLFVNNSNDNEFFQLVMPHICDVNEDNRGVLLEAANEVNKGYKVVKVCLFDDSVWLFFENFLDSSPDVSDILPRALNALQGARQEFYDKIR